MEHEPINPVATIPPNPKDKILMLDPEKDSKFFSPISKKWYFVEPRIYELSTHRTQILERRLIELGFTADFNYVTSKMREAMTLITKNKTHDAYTTLQNIVVGLFDLDNKTDIALWVCTVFIYEEGENPWEYSEQHAMQKIESWACFNKGFFLKSAINLLADYRVDLAELFPESSELPQNEIVKRERRAALQNLFGQKPNLT